jgi:hypothetical protein
MHVMHYGEGVGSLENGRCRTKRKSVVYIRATRSSPIGLYPRREYFRGDIPLILFTFA